MSTAELLEQLHQHGQQRRANVGGILFDRDADDLLSFMVEVDDEMLALDADVQQQLNGLGAFDFNGWVSFYQGNTGPKGDDTPDPWIPGLHNWRGFYADRSGEWDRLFHTDEVWLQTQAYETALARWQAQFEAAGGHASKPAPKPGFDRPSTPLGTNDLREFGKGVLTVGALFAGGYLLAQVLKLGGR